MPSAEYMSTRLRLLDDGSVSNKRVERYILMLCDGVERGSAWNLTGSKAKADGGTSGNTYLRNIERSPVFLQRAEYLMGRKEELEASGIWGKIQWQSEVMYLTARAKDDDKLAMEATTMLMKVAEKTTPAPTKPDPADEDVEPGAAPRGRGVPVASNPQNRIDVTGMRDKLMRYGEDQVPVAPE